MIRNNRIQSCWKVLLEYICFPFLLLGGMAGCQDFTDDTGQTMPEPDLKFVEEILNLPSEEKEYTVDIESNLPWRVGTSATWIDLLSSNGMGTGSFKMSVSENMNVAPREAEIEGWIIEGAGKKLKVVQEGVGIALKKRALKVGAKGSAEEVIPFSTMVAYSYQLSDPDCDWVHVSDAGGFTPGVVNDLELKLRIDTYLGTEEGRTVELHLIGTNGVTDVLTITQDQKPLEDIDYLRMFYEGANGMNWIKKWNFDAELKTDAMNWPGVTVKNGRVTDILFGTDNNIIGDITPLCYLSELKTLKLTRQHITSIPEEIGLLNNLTVLWVRESSLDGVIPESIANCQLLTEINFSNTPNTTPTEFKNNLTGGIGMLIDIPGLVTVKLYCNQFSGPLPAIPLDKNNNPTTWKKLKEFMVYSNRLSGSIPYGYGTVIAKSGSAGLFWVNDNQLSGTIPADIMTIPRYQTVANEKQIRLLQGNNLTE